MVLVVTKSKTPLFLLGGNLCYSKTLDPLLACAPENFSGVGPAPEYCTELAG